MIAPPAPLIPPGLGELAICLTQFEDVLTLVVHGEGDIGTTGQLREALVSAVGERPVMIVVDLADLIFCDCQGMDALHAGLDAAESAGVVMTVRGMAPQLAMLRRMFPRPRTEYTPIDLGIDRQPGTPASTGAAPTQCGDRPALR